jgi:putative membrane protein
MGGLIIRLVINALALLAAEFLVNLLIPNGMSLTNQMPDMLFVILIFGLVSALVRPVVNLLSCPVTVLTLGLFTLVINALMLLLTSYLAGVFGNREWLSFAGPWDGFLAALLAGIVVSVVGTVLSVVLNDAG